LKINNGKNQHQSAAIVVTSDGRRPFFALSAIQLKSTG
jgi:hypothetical protein